MDTKPLTDMISSLFPEYTATDTDNRWKLSSFSAEGFASDSERLRLEEKYWPLADITDRFDRKSVSFQLSKNDSIHSWLKYKEGFSAELVRNLISEFKLQPDDTILDPFMGSGTTALVASAENINSIGYDILPMSAIAIKAKSAVHDYNIAELHRLIEFIASRELPGNYRQETPYITITEEGYPKQNAIELNYFTELIASSDFSDNCKTLFRLCAINILERISYSAKDGQYLRWDIRSPKIIRAIQKREETGRRPMVVKLNKGDIPSFRNAIISELNQFIADIELIRNTMPRRKGCSCDFHEGSVLYKLPLRASESIDAVITSPPYCNRYDYTRTYALELAYLGVSDTRIRQLRQDLLSCTVENKSKVSHLSDFYTSIGRAADFERICGILQSCEPLKEVIEALKLRMANGEINNKGVIPMVEGYFTELTFLFFELFRTCRHSAKVAFVNDNVRYAGEVIPVDFISTAIAEQIGFRPVKIYVLRQQKGNSSQQMKKYGRVALRKSITVWEKP